MLKPIVPFPIFPIFQHLLPERLAEAWELAIALVYICSSASIPTFDRTIASLVAQSFAVLREFVHVDSWLVALGIFISTSDESRGLFGDGNVVRVVIVITVGYREGHGVDEVGREEKRGKESLGAHCAV